MKSVMTTTLIAIAFLCGCQSSRQYIHGYGDPRTRIDVACVIPDGGSRPIAFQLVDGTWRVLIQDRSFQEDPVSGDTVRTQDGDLYWGQENFEERIALDYTSDLASELLQAMYEYLAAGCDVERHERDYQQLRPFIEKIVRERVMRQDRADSEALAEWLAKEREQDAAPEPSEDRSPDGR